MSALRCRPVALLMLMVFLAGCTTWRPTTLSPAQVIQEEGPSSIRVTRSDGTHVTVTRPVVHNDSIAVLEQACQTSSVAGGRFGCREFTRTLVPLGDVAGVEVSTVSGWRTATVLGAIGSAVGIIYMYTSHPECSSRSSELDTASCVGFGLLLGGAPGALLGALAGLLN